jgi:hypothetical protein
MNNKYTNPRSGSGTPALSFGADIELSMSDHTSLSRGSQRSPHAVPREEEYMQGGREGSRLRLCNRGGSDERLACSSACGSRSESRATMDREFGGRERTTDQSLAHMVRVARIANRNGRNCLAEQFRAEAASHMTESLRAQN